MRADKDALVAVLRRYSTPPFPGVKASWGAVADLQRDAYFATYVATKDGAHRFQTATVSAHEWYEDRGIMSIINRLLSIPPVVMLYMPGSEAYCWQPALPFEEE